MKTERGREQVLKVKGEKSPGAEQKSRGLLAAFSGLKFLGRHERSHREKAMSERISRVDSKE